MEPGEAVDEALAAARDGCRAFQVKGTGEVARDVAVVGQLRAALGADALLRLDANQGYRGRGTKAAIRAVRALADAGADLVEQPTEGLDEMAAVCAAVDLPVVADESCWQPRDLLEVHARRAADAISIYVAKAGGLSRARTLAAIAEACGLPCDVNGSLETGIGTAASLQLATAMPAISMPAVIPVSAPEGAGAARATGRYYADDLIAEPLTFADGALRAPDDPGLGVELDEEKLDRYRVDRP
jgi:muconate cycloisomerase